MEQVDSIVLSKDTPNVLLIPAEQVSDVSKCEAQIFYVSADFQFQDSSRPYF